MGLWAFQSTSSELFAKTSRTEVGRLRYSQSIHNEILQIYDNVDSHVISVAHLSD